MNEFLTINLIYNTLKELNYCNAKYYSACESKNDFVNYNT